MMIELLKMLEPYITELLMVSTALLIRAIERRFLNRKNKRQMKELKEQYKKES